MTADLDQPREYRPLNRGRGRGRDHDPAPVKAQDEPRPWEIPTPVSRRREQAQRQQKAQRLAEAVATPRPALARPLTPEELRHVAELSRAGVVRRGRPTPPAFDCACTDAGRCALHELTQGQEHPQAKAPAWLPPED
jgi:hypothetical protein